MKSFIKSHKRNESAQSTGSSLHTMKTPISSPILNQSPSSNIPSSTTSSPKKLLIPIKHLFHKRRSLGDLQGLAIPSTHVAQIHKDARRLNSIKSKGSAKHHTRSVRSRVSTKTSKSDTNTTLGNGYGANDDSSSIDSDDSQFSFVKDIIGGRNTSIKYYKSKPTKADPPKLPEYESLAYYDNVENDIDVEDDYDYENNGFSDIDNMEEDINYIDDFDNYEDRSFGGNLNIDHDDNASRGDHSFQYSGDYDANFNKMESIESPQFFVDHVKKPFYLSYHASVEGIPYSSEEKLDNSDLIDSYLEFDDDDGTPFKPQTPRFENFDDFQLFDLQSPSITGITVGSERRDFFDVKSPNILMYKLKHDIRCLHSSIDELDILRKRDAFFKDEQHIPTPLDFGPELTAPSTDPTTLEINSLQSPNLNVVENDLVTQSSKSLTELDEASLEIGKALRNLESKDSVVTSSTSSNGGKINRLSINDMMNILENLQITNEQTQKNKRDSIENMMSFLRTIQKSQPDLAIKNHTKLPTVKEPSPPAKYVEDDDVDNFKSHDTDINDLEKDLIDEINQLPEDFDFDANEGLMDQFNELNKSIQMNSFMRSNSFTKKPKKMLASPLKNCVSNNNNKIETTGKTVTFYNKPSTRSRNKSPNSIEDLSTISERN